jgi:phage head maturation protease
MFANRATDLMPDNFWHSTKLRLRDFDPEIAATGDMSCSAVISTGSAVRREYGFERLEISREAVDLSRIDSAGIPVLDSHRIDSIGSSLGRVTSVWTKDGELRGRLAFNATDSGRRAFGLIERGEVRGLSPGYRVEEWEIRDQAGNVVDPEKEYGRWTDDDLTFVAVRWQLLEISLCAVPQDGHAVCDVAGGEDRAFPIAPPDPHRDIRERMEIRTRMLLRMNGVPSRGNVAGQSLSLWRHPTIFDRGEDNDDPARPVAVRRDLIRYGDSGDGGVRRVPMPPERQVDPPWGR